MGYTMNMSRKPSTMFGHLWRLVRGEEITSFVRAVCLALAVGLICMGWQPAFAPHSRAYQAPVFDVVHKFPLQLWGFWFLVDAALMLFAALSARLVWYVCAVLFSTITIAGWASAVIAADIMIPEADLTSGAFGLYIFSGVAILGLAFSPRQILAERPIVAITEDDEVIPLIRKAS